MVLNYCIPTFYSIDLFLCMLANVVVGWGGGGIFWYVRFRHTYSGESRVLSWYFCLIHQMSLDFSLKGLGEIFSKFCFILIYSYSCLWGKGERANHITCLTYNKSSLLWIQIAMVAKFLDEKNLKHHLKWIYSFSNFIDLIQFHLRLEKKRRFLSCAALLCKVDAWN